MNKKNFQQVTIDIVKLNHSQVISTSNRGAVGVEDYEIVNDGTPLEW